MKLTDTVYGGIYEYYRTDNDEVVYRGSAKLTPSRTKENLLLIRPNSCFGSKLAVYAS